MTSSKPARATLAASAAAVLALLCAAYANHFRNGFHFDDSHAILDNVAIRSLGYVPRYFVDATTFSVLPLNQSYRPVLQTTLAVDYRIAGGYDPFVFQADTFLWFVVLAASVFALFDAIAGGWVALVATAVFALHPVAAETVNYVVQRGDLLSTLGVVGALVLYVRFPSWRARGLYLAPFALGVLAKPPALVFPVLLLAYLRLYEPDVRRVRGVAPSAIVAIVAAWWLHNRTPPTAITGAADPVRYVLTQPFVWLRYAAAFVAPVDLSADNDWPLVRGWTDPRVAIGLIFVATIAAIAWRTGKARGTRGVSFGLIWFCVALLPTSLTPLAEVANDHRMFFPLIGLSLAATTAAALAVTRIAPSATRRSAIAVAVAALFVCEAAGVRARNRVWFDDETLWRDVTEKSPGNGRGWMNYGVTLMQRGESARAIGAFEKALPLTPAYSLLWINLGVAYGAAGRSADAERAFVQAIGLAPGDWRSHVYYARWLAGSRRFAEGLAHATIARELNPADPAGDAIVEATRSASGTPEFFLARSLAEYQMGRYRESIASAERAIVLRPGYAEAFNNVAAAHNAVGEWDAGIDAAEQAVRLDPSLTIAKNNLALARARRAAAAR